MIKVEKKESVHGSNMFGIWMCPNCKRTKERNYDDLASTFEPYCENTKICGELETVMDYIGNNYIKITNKYQK